MNVAEKPRRFGTISPEAIVGIGITIAELGILCLLLGWAEHMRSVPTVAWIWLALGTALFVLGGLAAVSAGSKDRRRTRAERHSSAAVPEDAAQSEPEEQRE
jgi:hypothetical protein